MWKPVLFHMIQFSISMQFSSIWPIDRGLSGATIPGQIGPGSDGNEGVLRIPQSSSIIGASPSDCLVSYPGRSLGRIRLQKCSRCILQTHPSQLGKIEMVLYIWFSINVYEYTHAKNNCLS